MAKLSFSLLLLLTACSHDTRQAMQVLSRPVAPAVSLIIPANEPPLVREAKDQDNAVYILTHPKTK